MDQGTTIRQQEIKGNKWNNMCYKGKMEGLRHVSNGALNCILYLV